MNWSTLPPPDPTASALGTALAEWRAAQPQTPLVRPREGMQRRAGCTQGQLAAALGVAIITIKRWEAGGTVPEDGRKRLEALRSGGPEAVKRVAQKQARARFAPAS